MLLHHVDTGSGDRFAILLHGMMGSGESWWRVADALASDGYRVLALDLPGHGLSPRDSHLTVAAAADAVVETARHVAPDASPALAIGHSYGGRVLAVAAARLNAEHTVYVDAPFTSEWANAELTADERAEERSQWEAARLARTVENMRREKTHYGERDLENEARAAERFDSDTAVAVSNSPDAPAYPGAGTLLIRAHPSDYVSDELAARLESEGVTVRSIRGAAHSVWYSDYDAFMAALDGWR